MNNNVQDKMLAFKLFICYGALRKSDALKNNPETKYVNCYLNAIYSIFNDN